MISNGKDRDEKAGGVTSKYVGWERTLDVDDDVMTPAGDDVSSYDADDAMLEFAERYFNAQPAQFGHSALARTVNIVTRKSLNVSTYRSLSLSLPHRPHRNNHC